MRTYVSILAVAAVCLAGCGGGGGSGGNETATVPSTDSLGPTIRFCSVTPATLPCTGGTVTVSATITDPAAVHSARAYVTRPDASVVALDMFDDAVHSQYTATWKDASTNATSSDVGYKVTVEAIDGDGHKASSPEFGFAVLALDTTGPTITDCTVASMDFTGGGSLTVHVTDASGVAVVTAVVGPWMGAVTLSRQGDSDTYAGGLGIPANTGSTASSGTIRVEAVDRAGNKSSAPEVPWTVPALDMPPPPPK